jgi:hypothetical protein
MSFADFMNPSSYVGRRSTRIIVFEIACHGTCLLLSCGLLAVHDVVHLASQILWVYVYVH